jgi:hypothetical protein
MVELPGMGYPERIGVTVEIQPGNGGEPDSGVELGPRRAGEHLDRVPQRDQFTGQMAGVDPLAPTAGIAPVDEERDAQTPWLRRRGGNGGRDLDVAGALPGFPDLLPLLTGSFRHRVVRHIQAWPPSLPECRASAQTVAVFVPRRGQLIPNHPRMVSPTKTVATAATERIEAPPSQRATGPLAAGPRRERRLASTRISTRVIGVITPSSTWVFKMRVIRLPGTSTTAAPTSDLRGEEPEKQRSLTEAGRHRPLHADGFGHRIGRRQRDDGGGQRRCPEQAETEQDLGRRAGDGAECVGRVGGRCERSRCHRWSAPVATMIDMATNVGQDRPPTDGIDPLKAVVLRLDPLVHHRAGLVQLDVGGDGGADQRDGEKDEGLVRDEVGPERVRDDAVPVWVAEDRGDEVRAEPQGEHQEHPLCVPVRAEEHEGPDRDRSNRDRQVTGDPEEIERSGNPAELGHHESDIGNAEGDDRKRGDA